MSKLALRRKHLAEALMRDSICEATASVLAEAGLANLTMDRVAEAAGVSKGTVYNYFHDRDALLLEVVNSAFGPLHAELDRVFTARPDVPGVLIEATRIILAYVEERRGLGKVFCGGELPPFLEARFRESHMRLRGQFTEVFRRAAACGTLRGDCDAPAAAARLLIVSLHGIIDERILYPDKCPPLAEELDFLAQFMISPWFKETK